jgi:hypothetical protein
MQPHQLSPHFVISSEAYYKYTYIRKMYVNEY